MSEIKGSLLHFWVGMTILAYSVSNNLRYLVSITYCNWLCESVWHKWQFVCYIQINSSILWNHKRNFEPFWRAPTLTHYSSEDVKPLILNLCISSVRGLRKLRASLFAYINYSLTYKRKIKRKVLYWLKCVHYTINKISRLWSCDYQVKMFLNCKKNIKCCFRTCALEQDSRSNMSSHQFWKSE